MKSIRHFSFYILLALSLIGIFDATYLTYEHYRQDLVPCSTNSWIDCGKVLKGPYSEIGGIPVSLFGLLFYFSFFVVLLLSKKYKHNIFLKYYLIVSSSFAFLFSVYLVSLMILIIKAICTYCMLSALTSTTLFIITLDTFPLERKRLSVIKIGWLYKNILKKIYFMIEAETVHERMLSFGELSGEISLFKKFAKWMLVNEEKSLSQQIAGIDFKFPVGMAAGFDYEAKLTQFLPSLGFGFATVGTITNIPYEGNPKPRLGRLPKSRSLLVNKGFKNEGAEFIAKKLSKLNFDYAQGVSIGRSNNEKLNTQKKSVEDILSAFKAFEINKVQNMYYELNISCPNLIHGSVDFYEPKNLDELLNAVDKLRLKKPVFIKMPIEKSDKETLDMLSIITRHSPKGVIFGNLQKDKNHKSIDKDETASLRCL